MGCERTLEDSPKSAFANMGKLHIVMATDQDEFDKPDAKLLPRHVGIFTENSDSNIPCDYEKEVRTHYGVADVADRRTEHVPIIAHSRGYSTQ